MDIASSVCNWDVRGIPVLLSEADFGAWRDQLQTLEELGAFALVERNLVVNGDVEPVELPR